MSRLLAAAVLLAAAGYALSQGPPPPRTHTVTQKGELTLRPANQRPPAENRVSIEVQGDHRVLTANGIPAHAVGQFPGRGNPNRITEQRHRVRLPLEPQVNETPTPFRHTFGYALNGVPFEPGAGEFFATDRRWQYEPLSGAINLGIDMSHAHVQPTGKYHYHGLPTGLLETIDLKAGAHSPLVGWAGDGFPIYALYGHADPDDAASEVTTLRSSYRLKPGNRPGGAAPGGVHDGTFVNDYEFAAGSGDLDECNGRVCVTPDFPDGTYAYFLTEEWPVIPRMWRGTPSEDMSEGGGMRGGPGTRGGPPGRFPPPRRRPR